AGGSGDEVGGGGGEGEEAAVLAEDGLRADVVAGSGAVGAGNERSGSGAGSDIHAGGADENLLNPQRIVGESGGVGAERDEEPLVGGGRLKAGPVRRRGSIGSGDEERGGSAAGGDAKAG